MTDQERAQERAARAEQTRERLARGHRAEHKPNPTRDDRLARTFQPDDQYERAIALRDANDPAFRTLPTHFRAALAHYETAKRAHERTQE